MKTGVNLRAKLLSSLVLIVIVTIGFSYASASEVNKSAMGNASPTPIEKNIGFDKGNNACDIIACIGEIKDECDMKIEVMINPGPEPQSDIDESFIKKIRKAINIKFIKDWPFDSSKLAKPCLQKDDLISYKRYKVEGADHDIITLTHYFKIFSISQTMQLEQNVRECDFTYDELLQMAEGLVQQDKAQLGKETILVKSRRFQQVPIETFFESPIIKKPY